LVHFEKIDNLATIAVMSLKVRIYLDKKLDLGLDLILEKEDSHYLKNVMRIKQGDNIFLFNSKDGEFKAEIISFDKKNTRVKLISKIENSNKRAEISLIFSLIKSSKLDYLIQKCTEIGVKDFIPVVSDKSVAKNINIKRFEKIIKESCEQSNQIFLPTIQEVEKLEKKLKLLDKNSIIFFADINSTNEEIDNVFKNNKNKNFYLLVGPEGDFSLKERALLENMSNCIPFSLGQNILRSETAAVAGLVLLNSQIN
jgi:16S rRNA (uracil1498-N3)-methyltransferase